MEVSNVKTVSESMVRSDEINFPAVSSEVLAPASISMFSASNGELNPKKLKSSVVSLGSNHSAAITTNGDLYCWGRNDCGQIGNGTTENQNTPLKILTDVREVFLDGNNSAAITANGDLYCWGLNRFGELGIGTETPQLTPIKVLENVQTVELAQTHGAAVTTNGDLYCWGCNDYGQIGNGTTINQPVPVKVLEQVSDISISNLFSSAVTTNGDLYCWGYNNSGMVGNGTTISQVTPTKILENVEFAYARGANIGAITTNKDLYCWGSNVDRQVGNGSSSDQTTPVKILENVSDFSLGSDNSAAVTTNGDLYCWGKNTYGQVGARTGSSQSSPLKILENISKVSLGYLCGMAVSKEGDLYCWGYNKYGGIGDGTTTDQYIPVKVLENVLMAISGYTYNSAVTTSGDLYCWGSNSYGQVGNGSTKDQSKPVKIMGDVWIDNSGSVHPGDYLTTFPQNGFTNAMRWGDNFIITFDKLLDEEFPTGDGTISFYDAATDEELLRVNSDENKGGGGNESYFYTDYKNTLRINICSQNALPNDKEIYVTLSEKVVKFDDGTYNKAYESKEFWRFCTFPVDTSSVTNLSVSKEITDDKYNVFFKPLTALQWKVFDDGTNGICFGMCYSAVAWKDNYNTIRDVVTDKYLSQADVNKKTMNDISLLDYMQYAQIYQHTSLVQKTKDSSLENIYNKINDYLNNDGQPIILGAKNSNGGHAFLPVDIEKTNKGCRVLLYNCNSPIEYYYLEMDETPVGEWQGWRIKYVIYTSDEIREEEIYSQEDKIWCTSLDETCDTVIKMVDENYQEEKNLLITKLDSFSVNGNEFYQGINEGGDTLIPIISVSGNKTAQDYYLYWTDADSLIIDSNGNIFDEVTLCEGNKEYTMSADVPAKVSIDLNDSSDKVEAKLQTSGEIAIENNNVVDNKIQSIIIKGKTNSEVVTMIKDDGRYIVEGIQNLDISSQLDGEGSKLVVEELESDKKYIIAVEESTISVGLDNDGDGVIDDLIASTIDKIYTVTFDSNGGNCDINEIETDADGKIGKLPEASREGHEFKGWFTEAENGEEVTEETVFVADTTIYAHWESNGEVPPEKYTITLDTNGGNCETGKIETDADGKITQLPEASREGYEFKGWFTGAESGDEVTEETVFTADTTIYAHWEPNEEVPPEKYTITLDANGGSCETGEIETDADGKITQLPEASREGYEFKGWFTEAENGNKVTEETIFAANTAIYAHWKLNGEVPPEQYTITLDANGGNCETGEIQTGANGKIEQLPTANREGYIFKGWFTEAQNGDEVTEETVFTADTTIYASWELNGEVPPEKYTIMLDANGGNCEIGEIETDADGKITQLPEASREGYIFKGWFTETQNGNEVTEETVFTADTTIYAHWELNGEVPPEQYTITLDANGGNCETREIETDADGKIEQLPTASREGYVFKGWFTEAQDGEKVTEETVFVADTTVYAHWSVQGSKSDGIKKDGNVSGTNNNTNTTAPRTGDNNNLIIWFIMMSVSGIILLAYGLFWFKRKKSVL